MIPRISYEEYQDLKERLGKDVFRVAEFGEYIGDYIDVVNFKVLERQDNLKGVYCFESGMYVAVYYIPEELDEETTAIMQDYFDYHCLDENMLLAMKENMKEDYLKDCLSMFKIHTGAKDPDFIKKIDKDLRKFFDTVNDVVFEYPYGAYSTSMQKELDMLIERYRVKC
jgi:hypothetical protein